MPIHDIAMLGLIVLSAAAILCVRILWDIFKLIRGFWIDYRKVNRLELVCPIFCTSFIVSVARLSLLIDSRSRGCGEVGSA